MSGAAAAASVPDAAASALTPRRTCWISRVDWSPNAMVEQPGAARVRLGIRRIGGLADRWRQTGRPDVLLYFSLGQAPPPATAVMWRRFGTPTDKADSGTEEEIRDAYAAGAGARRPHPVQRARPNLPTHEPRRERCVRLD
jgi:hypothetical protein